MQTLDKSGKRIHPAGRWGVVALLALSIWSGAAEADQNRTPTEAVQGTIQEFLYVLTELNDPSRASQRTWEFEQTVRRHFLYEEMAKQSLGEAWGGLSSAERRQFVRLFVQVLRDEISDRLRGYGAGEVVYVSERREDDRAEVGISLTSADLESKLEFRVTRVSGDWVIDDLRIDGASLLERYRMQFARILKDATFADLMERMRQRTLLVEAFEKAGS